MRVVAGTSGGRRLATPVGRDVRPTTDRVREATFNALGSMGVTAPPTVLDLFAGSGALGIEALSRGAHHCTFVDGDRRAIEVVKANLATCGLTAQAAIVKQDALRYLTALDPSARFDLALLDPPYAFDVWDDLLGRLPADVAVIESDREIAPPDPWVVVRQKRYGTTLVTLVQRESSTADSAPTSSPDPVPAPTPVAPEQP